MKITRYLALTCAAVMAAACMMFSASAADDVTTADNAAITDDVTTTDDADTNNDVTTDDDMLIDEANFPDKLFREYISENYDIDKNGSLSAEEIEGAEELSLSDYIFKDPIEFDLTGVENFKKLKSIALPFDVINADLSEIEALTDISFTGGNVSGLVLGDMSSLEDIYIYNSDLTELSLVDCPELVQCCFNNNTKLAKLEIKNAPKLIAIDCRDNALVSLKTDNCSGMFYLRCSNNKLTKLNITNCPLLALIDCSKNMIAELDITPFNNIIDELKNFDGMPGDEAPLIVDSGTKVIGYDMSESDISESSESAVESSASSETQEKEKGSKLTMLVAALAAIVIAGIAAVVIILMVKGGKEK